MSIIQFPDSRDNLVRRNNETPANKIESQLGTLLAQTPDNVNSIINKEYTSPEKLVLVNPEELKALILDYIIFHLHRTKVNLEGSIIFGIQYISELLFKIFLFQGEEVKLIVEHPYYTHWMDQGYPKRAGDASVYSYMFRGFEKKPIKQENYIPFAVSAYLEYSKDPDFAKGIGGMLPIIGNMLKDEKFLKRGILKGI